MGAFAWNEPRAPLVASRASSWTSSRASSFAFLNFFLGLLWLLLGLLGLLLGLLGLLVRLLGLFLGLPSLLLGPRFRPLSSPDDSKTSPPPIPQGSKKRIKYSAKY